jgi:cobalt-precorrin-7 (C5)-methyltransferase
MKISIVGIGPGKPEYMLLAAADAFRQSDVIIGGERNLRSIDTSGKETMVIKDNLISIIDFIKENYKTKKIAVAASGDPGFFGILGYMKKYFQDNDLEVLPGISSVQYFFAKLNMPWDDAFTGSFHGRDYDPAAVMREHKKAVFLTDNKRTYRHIAELLCKAGLGDLMMYVGANLSYNDEKIIKGKAKDIVVMTDEYKLCVAVVLNEK